MSAATGDSFAIFLGCGRSGTTLVRSMFDSHPDLAVTHEAKVLASLGRHRRRYESKHGLHVDRLVDDLYGAPQFRHLGLDRDLVAAAARADNATFAGAMRQIWRTYAERAGKVRYGDKTPGYVMRIPMLAELFPEAQFVHVIRDGRDSALSYLARGYGPRDVAQAALRWRRRVTRGRRTGARLGAGRYCELRYEDLIADPAMALGPVCDFLHLEFDPAMLRYHERADELLAATRQPKNFENLSRPPTSGLRDWRTQMPRDDLALFEAIAGQVLEELGYERASEDNPTVRQRANLWRSRLAWEWQRALSVARENAGTRLGELGRKRRRRP